MYPRQIRRHCAPEGGSYRCLNPRTHTISGLTDGAAYEIEVLALNANSPQFFDETPPAFSSAAVNGATLTVTFDENLGTGSVPAHGDFHITVGGSRRNVTFGGVAISGPTVSLTLESAVVRGEAVKIRYTKGLNPLQTPPATRLPPSPTRRCSTPRERGQQRRTDGKLRRASF